MACLSLGAALPSSQAGRVPGWEFSVIAVGGIDSLSNPALDRDAATGAWQVAFGASLPGIWAAGSALVPGIHLRTLGGTRRTLAKDGDTVPSAPGFVFCFSAGCGATVGPASPSLSQGEVAFKALARSVGVPTAISGIYVINGARGPLRMADTTMPMPGFPGSNFAVFDHPSLNEGRVVFTAASDGATPPAMQGVYGNFGGPAPIVVADFNSRPPLGDAAEAFSAFGAYPSVSRTYTGLDDVNVAFWATGRVGAQANVRGVYTRSLRGGTPNSWATVAASPSYFPYNATSLLSPSIDFGGKVAFKADIRSDLAPTTHPTGVYSGSPTNAVADVQTPAPGGAGNFASFGDFPAIDAAPRQPGQVPQDRWIAFTGADAPGESGPTHGVFLARQTGLSSYLVQQLIDSSALWQLLAPWAGRSTLEESPPLKVTLFHQAVKDGAVAFRVSVPGSVARDYIIVARQSSPTLSLKAEADTYIRADLQVRENDNYGMQDFVEVGNGREGGTPPDRMRALLRFNVGVLPALDLSSAAVEATLHSYDNGMASSVYTVNAHALAAAWTGAAPAGEGNGFEGTRPPGAAPALTDPDSAYGVAWAGGVSNPDANGANNSSQPPFDARVLATQQVLQQVHVTGDKFQWDITPLAGQWLRKLVPSHGVLLSETGTEATFRGLRLGSREGEVYGLPRSVSGPRLLLSWVVGTEPGDLTGDACVDRDDLAILMAVLRGQAVAGASLTPRLDLNGDGKVDIADSRKLVTLFSRPLGAACN